MSNAIFSRQPHAATTTLTITLNTNYFLRDKQSLGQQIRRHRERFFIEFDRMMKQYCRDNNLDLPDETINEMAAEAWPQVQQYLEENI